jgi:hypothetical protein
MDSKYELLAIGVAMLVLGALGLALFARITRKGKNEDPDKILGVMFVCGALTALNGGGVLAIANAAFSFGNLVGLGIVTAAIAGLAAMIKIFWRVFGVHKLVYQPPARTAANEQLGLTKSSKPNQQAAA